MPEEFYMLERRNTDDGELELQKFFEDMEVAKDFAEKDYQKWCKKEDIDEEDIKKIRWGKSTKKATSGDLNDMIRYDIKLCQLEEAEEETAED